MAEIEATGLGLLVETSWGHLFDVSAQEGHRWHRDLEAVHWQGTLDLRG